MRGLEDRQRTPEARQYVYLCEDICECVRMCECVLAVCVCVSVCVCGCVCVCVCVRVCVEDVFVEAYKCIW